MRPGVGDERGSAILEVALTLPILLLVSVGIFEFGRAFQTWQVLTNAAREGARIAVLPGMQETTIQDRVKQYMRSGMLPVRAGENVIVDRSATIDIGAAAASASVVTVTYPFNFMVLNPVARLVAGNRAVGGAPLTMTASAAMRNESQF